MFKAPFVLNFNTRSWTMRSHYSVNQTVVTDSRQKDRNDRGFDVNITSIRVVEVLVILVGSFIRLIIDGLLLSQ